MTTQQTNTLSQCDSSTVPSACAAHALDGEHRQQLAVQALARTEPVTELAARHGVSLSIIKRTKARRRWSRRFNRRAQTTRRGCSTCR